MTQELRPVQRIAAAQAARAKVDNQGQPTTAPTEYEYDSRGLLIRATPASFEDE